jgi:hypothetical protein
MNDKEIDIKGNEIAKILRDSIIEKIPLIGSDIVRIISWQETVRNQRIISFIEDFISSLQGIDKSEINWEYLSSQDYFDLLASVSQKVEQTSSKEKLRRFKDILIKEIKTPYVSEFKDTFLDILSKINEDQIKILDFYYQVDLGKITLPQVSGSTTGIRQFNGKNENTYLNETYFKMEQEVYEFLIQDLISKYLLINFNSGIGPLFQRQSFPKISPLGMEFLEFIKTA